MKLIDADKWLADIRKVAESIEYPMDYVHMSQIVSNVENAPSVDAVPVIRCKDCEEMFIGARGDRLCWLMECQEVGEEDFCCWATRKKKGDL